MCFLWNLKIFDMFTQFSNVLQTQCPECYFLYIKILCSIWNLDQVCKILDKTLSVRRDLAIVRKLVNLQYNPVSMSKYRVNNTVSIFKVLYQYAYTEVLIKWHGIIETEFQNLRTSLKKTFNKKSWVQF